MEKSLRSIGYVFALVLVTLFVTTIAERKLSTYHHELSLFKTHPSSKTVERELECMALNIYREAGNEPFEGKVAVAQVTLNRVEHELFPDSVCDVVYQKTKFTEKVVCQFSWYCDAIHRARPINKASYNESYEVAKKVLLEGFRLDSIKDALYYHADYVSPNWRYKRVAKIGTHIFYKDARDDI
jgi:spore germination cell wall hydrolase CwlJ-like protein